MLLNGKAPLPGQIIQLPNLAKTFRALAEQGKDGFYKGRVAEAIVELIQSKGGVMELSDLAKYETSFVEPISYNFHGEVTLYEVCEPEPIQGLQVDHCYSVHQMGKVSPRCWPWVFLRAWRRRARSSHYSN